MSEVLSRVQPYIHLEEVIKTSFNHTVKHGDDGGKSKSPHEASAHAQDQHWGATCLQETGALNPFTKSALNLQADGTPFHSVDTPHQRGLQHHQQP